MTAEFTYPVTDCAPSAGPTPWQTVGPFFHYALPYPPGSRVVGPERPGAFRLEGAVLDGNGDPVPDSLVEIWQADEQGGFAEGSGLFFQDLAGTQFRGFGRCETDARGGFGFTTVKPAGVPTLDGEAQAPHLAMSVFARGMLRRAVTRVYFDDEADANAVDPLLGAVEDSRRHTLIAATVRGGYRFDVHLQGNDETVFLHAVGT